MAKPKITLREGDRAPNFSAPTNGGGTVRLSDFANAGHQVVLYFYPRDNTPGCTREACGFRDAHDRFRHKKAVVLGVSKDPVKSHDKFVEKFGLPFLLVSDKDAAVAKAYGVWGEKKFMGRTFTGMHRVTFLIDGRGRIKKVRPEVKPDQHAAEVLAAL